MRRYFPPHPAGSLSFSRLSIHLYAFFFFSSERNLAPQDELACNPAIAGADKRVEEMEEEKKNLESKIHNSELNLKFRIGFRI